ncbi:hypothetical protein HDU76_002309 [Blyttiomyces sp. JEL0837]|nr:hypothetical protein HDU76_002309 [Blyttiomyces sp. JEL0837]
MATYQDLVEAVKKNDVAFVESALKTDPKLAWSKDPSTNVSLLLLTRYYSRQEILKQLLTHRKGDLTIHEATAVGDLPTITRLIKDSSVNLNSYSPDGFTPLTYICFFGDCPEAISVLVKAGANVNLKADNGQGVYPINSAAANQDPTKSLFMVQTLLELGADVNVKQERDFTALHEAASNNYPEMVELLLKYGADKSLKTTEGKTALDMAEAKKYHQIIELLK